MLNETIKSNHLVVVMEFNTATKTTNIKYIGRVTVVTKANNLNHVFITGIQSLDNINFVSADVLVRQSHYGVAIPYKKQNNIQEFILPLNSDFTQHEAFKDYEIDKVKLNDMVAHFINLDDNKEIIRLNLKFPKQPITTTRKRKSLKYRLMNCLNINLP